MELRGNTFCRSVLSSRGKTWCGLLTHIYACAENVHRVSFRSLSWQVNAVGLITKFFVLPIGRVAAGTFCLRVMFPSETCPRCSVAQSLSSIHLFLKASGCR